MAENNSSAPLLPCPFCGASARGYEIAPHQHSAALLALVPNMPKEHQGSYVIEGDCQCGSGLIGNNQAEVTARWNARAPHAVAAQAAPAAVAVPEITDAMVDAYLAEQRRTVEEADRFGRSNIGGLHTNTVRDACRNGLRAALAATPALPATEDSSAGDLAEGPAGSGGWKVHAESLEKECAYWKTMAETMRAHACKDVWYWQGDGNDNPQSMVNSLAVVIRADDLRELMAQPQAEVQAEPVIYVSRGQLETHTDPDSDGGRYLPARRTPLGLLNYPLYTEATAQPAFQQRVQPWMMECFGAEIAADCIERNHRFLEEALELVQATGCTQSEAHQLVDYVFGRPLGEPVQEAGGVMVTLAALCLANGLDMHQAGETELARVWTKVEAIRAKQAAKPKHSPLPQAQPADALDAPWSDLKVAFDIGIDGDDSLWVANDADELRLPEGWELIETTISGCAGFVAIFRVAHLPSSRETQEVRAAIDAAMAAAQEGGNAAKAE